MFKSFDDAAELSDAAANSFSWRIGGPAKLKRHAWGDVIVQPLQTTEGEHVIALRFVPIRFWMETLLDAEGVPPPLAERAKLLRLLTEGMFGAVPIGIRFAAADEPGCPPLPYELCTMLIVDTARSRRLLEWVEHCFLRYALPRTLSAARISMSRVARRHRRSVERTRRPKRV